MKKGIVLYAAILGLAVASCEPEPELGQAFEDLFATAPDVCTLFCDGYQSDVGYVDCAWMNEDAITGAQADALFADSVARCVMECAYKADSGVFFYEDEYNTETDPPTVTHDIKGIVEGEIWLDYLTCLVQATLWKCVDVNGDPDNPHWAFQIDDSTQENCVARATCVEMLRINLEYEWDPLAQEGAGACQPSGDEYIWNEW
jgi:hypothetical protein